MRRFHGLIPLGARETSRSLESFAEGKGCLHFAKPKCPRSKLCESQALLQISMPANITQFEEQSKLFLSPGEKAWRGSYYLRTPPLLAAVPTGSVWEIYVVAKEPVNPSEFTLV